MRMLCAKTAIFVGNANYFVLLFASYTVRQNEPLNWIPKFGLLTPRAILRSTGFFVVSDKISKLILKLKDTNRKRSRYLRRRE